MSKGTRVWRTAHLSLISRLDDTETIQFVLQTRRTNQPRRQKAYLRACEHSEDSDQPAHSFSESSLGTFRIAKDAKFLHADKKDWSDCAHTQADLSSMGAHFRRYVFVHRTTGFHCGKNNTITIITYASSKHNNPPGQPRNLASLCVAYPINIEHLKYG